MHCITACEGQSKPALKDRRLKCSEKKVLCIMMFLRCVCVCIRMCASERVKIGLPLILLGAGKAYKTLCKVQAWVVNLFFL